MGGLGTNTMFIDIGLIGKRLVDFLLVVIELILLGFTAEVLRAKTGRSPLRAFQSAQDEHRTLFVSLRKGLKKLR